MNALDETQTVWLIAAARGGRLYLPIVLAVSTVLRRGELLALRWTDADFSSGVLSVCRSLEQTKGGLRFKPPKNRRGRVLALPAIAIQALQEHRTMQQRTCRPLGAAYQDNDLICCREDGSVWKPDSFTDAYFKFARKIGLKARFHDLRHSHASQLLRAGVSPKVVSERLGHSSVGITLDVYSHVLPGMQEDAVKKLDAALENAAKAHCAPPLV